MSAHTPGPWVVTHDQHGDNGVVTRIGGESYCITHTVANAGPNSESGTADANARLIAAAPELMAALHELLARVDERCRGKAEGNSPLVAACDAARAALSKATGSEG